MSDTQTVRDWIRGYLLTYLPDTEGTEALVEDLLARAPGWAADRPLTDAQREILEEDWTGEARSLMEIIETVLDEEVGRYPSHVPRQICQHWLQNDAPDALRETGIDIHTDLPPIYADRLEEYARANIQSQL